jgi:hypothetical protein
MVHNGENSNKILLMLVYCGKRRLMRYVETFKSEMQPSAVFLLDMPDSPINVKKYRSPIL